MVADELMSGTKNVLNDVIIKRKKLKPSLKKQAKNSISDLFTKALNNQSGSGIRKRKQYITHVNTKKKKHSDIFA